MTCSSFTADTFPASFDFFLLPKGSKHFSGSGFEFANWNVTDKFRRREFGQTKPGDAQRNASLDTSSFSSSTS
jgi:hypothetical protein